jgi:lipoyl synthase
MTRQEFPPIRQPGCSVRHRSRSPARGIYDATAKQKSQAKTARIPIKIVPAETAQEAGLDPRQGGQPTTRFYEIKDILRANKLVTVCEEASCPNIGECFGKGTATFMIMGDKCTRRCPFCDVGHGRPNPLDAQNRTIWPAPSPTAQTQVRGDHQRGPRRPARRGRRPLRRVHPARYGRAPPATRIEVLVPDFRGRLTKALEILAGRAAGRDEPQPGDGAAPVQEARPGSDYAHSLALLRAFKALFPHVPTKSGLMVGLGETDEEILQVMRDMRAHDIDMLTIGQYLAPSGHHLPVRRYVHPDTFKMFEEKAYEMGFTHAAVGAMVRSSYHADQQAHGVLNPTQA